jgi:hypothetical protein
VTLSNGAARYRVEFEVGSSDVPVLVRRTTRFLDVFTINREKTLIEAFLHCDPRLDTPVISHIIDSTNATNTDIIMHFSRSLHPNYTWAANLRNTQYTHQGFGHIYFNGGLRTDNFHLPTVFDRFDENYTLSQTDRTYVVSSGFSADFNDNLLELSQTFSNPHTDIFTTELMLYNALIQPARYEDKTIQVITQFIGNQNGRNIVLPRGATVADTTGIPLYSINLLPGNEYRDLSVLTLVVDRNTKKIYFHEILSLEHIDFPDPDAIESIETPIVQIYPNPIKVGETMSMSFQKSTSQSEISVSIYNIRGQKLVSRKMSETTFTMDFPEINRSGIYLMKIDWNEEGHLRSRINKVLVIN